MIHPSPPVIDRQPFKLGDLVQKKGRASWRGKIVGEYNTELTARGYAVESLFEPGSVQIYPQPALEAWLPTASDRDVLVAEIERLREALRGARPYLDQFSKSVEAVDREMGLPSPQVALRDVIDCIDAALTPLGGEGR